MDQLPRLAAADVIAHAARELALLSLAGLAVRFDRCHAVGGLRALRPSQLAALASPAPGRLSRAGAIAGTVFPGCYLSGMCEKCAELDKRIERFKSIVDPFTDPEMVEGLTRRIDELEAQKAALHPDRK
jgi:hypothetical protein